MEIKNPAQQIMVEIYAKLPTNWGKTIKTVQNCKTNKLS